MKRFIKPNWKKNIINISATLAKFLGAPNSNATLPALEKELAKNYKNVVFICFDGLGINPIKLNLSKNDFFIKNIKQVLTSTFPSTTTNATTSLMTNTLPLQHGWFGWSLYFKDLKRNIELFTNKDAWTREFVEVKNSPLAPCNFYFEGSKSDYKINTIFPPYVKVQNQKQNNVFEDENGFFDAIKKVCNKKGKQFVYCYYPEPDMIMHDFGVSSKEAKILIQDLQEQTKLLFESVEDTLFIISADHGQIDIKGYIELYKDKTLLAMLKTPPFLESRAVAFVLKKGKDKEFKKYFKKLYGKDFKLYKSSTLIKKGCFGAFGDKGHLLGDYIAIGTYSHKEAILSPHVPKFYGNHTSMTEEMLVPLILIGKK